MKKYFLYFLISLCVITLFIAKPVYKTYTASTVKFISPWRFSTGGVIIKTVEKRDFFLSFADYRSLKDKNKVEGFVGFSFN